MGTKMRRGAALLAAGLLASAPAGAAIIDFDDLGTSGDAIANGYAGLQWDNLFALDPADAPPSGYANAAVSGTKVAYSGYDGAATIGGLDLFVLDSGYFTAAFNDGLTITATGYAGDQLVHQTSFTVDTRGPTQQVFKWGGISRVVFSAAGGTDQFFEMSGTNFALDSLSVAAVPEPSTWAMMIVGFGMVGGALRSRRPATAAA